MYQYSFFGFVRAEALQVQLQSCWMSMLKLQLYGYPPTRLGICSFSRPWDECPDKPYASCRMSDHDHQAARAISWLAVMMCHPPPPPP